MGKTFKDNKHNESYRSTYRVGKKVKEQSKRNRHKIKKLNSPVSNSYLKKLTADEWNEI